MISRRLIRIGGAALVVLLTVIPEGLAEFADRMIPELQHRSIFREAYEGTTLREHLNLFDVRIAKALA
ncbi:hypothetical protein ACJEDT_25475 (plasmid) [Rhodococcoides fascians]|uniref:hypothetical protein n=1 Tax=Rhodococcoides fascians TaxID=1828 RepID=UPI00389A9E94